MKVVVTGASGFIGRRLCARLVEDGHDVCALMRKPCEGPWTQAFALDLDAPAPVVGLEDADVVLHLASRVHEMNDTARAASAYERTNVEGTKALVESAMNAQVTRFVFVSSVKAIGESTEGQVDELSPTTPTTPYGVTKLAAERLVLASAPALQPVVVRLPAVYGTGAKGNVTAMLGAVKRGRFPPLPEFGNRRSLVHVDDVVGALVLCATHANAIGRTYIVTDTNSYSTRQLYLAMRKAVGQSPGNWVVPAWVFRAVARLGDVAGRLTGRSFPLDSMALEKLTATAWYSSHAIENELGYRPTMTLEDGLKEMVTVLRQREEGSDD